MSWYGVYLFTCAGAVYIYIIARDVPVSYAVAYIIFSKSASG